MNNIITIQLKRGYAINVLQESNGGGQVIPEIIILGNYSKSNYNATPIIDRNGIAPTVRENHGQVTAILSE